MPSPGSSLDTSSLHHKLPLVERLAISDSEKKNYNFQIYLCKVLFLNRRRKKLNLFLLTVGGDGVGVRVLVAGLRELVQLHVVHHHLGKQHSKC